MSSSPFKFLDSYTKEDKDIFFGRENEIEEIYTRVFQSKLLLVYGASGTGKSSLIQCGLANKFQDTDWLPVSIRRGLNISDSIFQQLQKLALTELKDAKDPADRLTKSLRSIYLDYFKPVYLIFDQFEELFIFGEREEWQDFIRNVKAAMNSDLNVKFIFVIRGEYLEYLSEFEEAIPDFFNNRIRIEKMTRQSALRCITGPCEQFGIGLEEMFPENLLHKLSPDRSEIELTYLQVFLDRIYKSAQSEGRDDLTFTNDSLEKLGNIGDVLSEFLDEQIDQTENKELSLALLKAFVTSQGTKKQVSVADAKTFANVLGHDISEPETEKIVLDLVNRRILKDKDEADRYELRHDSIAAKIYQKITQYERDLIEVKHFLEYAFEEHQKRDFLLNESDLAYVLPYRDRLILSQEINEFIDKSANIEAKKKRSRKQLYIVVITISVLLLGSIALFLYAMSSQREAESNLELAKKSEQEAQESARIAQVQTELAEEQRLLAEISAQEADSAAKVALTLKQEADESARLATLRSIQAQQEKERADASARFAIEQSDRAREQEQLALENAAIAQRNAEEAKQLRYLSVAKSLANKSLQIKDEDQKLLLAMQAIIFNNDYNGYAYDADIFSGLYSAQKTIRGEKFNTALTHSGPVQNIAWWGSRLVSVSGEGIIKTLEFDGNTLISESLSEIDGLVNSISVSPDGAALALALQEGYVEVLSASGENRKISVPDDDPVFLIDHMADGQMVFATDLGNIYTFDGEVPSPVEHHRSRVTALSAGLENQVFVGYEDGSLRTIKGGRESLLLPSLRNGAVRQIAVNDVLNYLVIGFENGAVIISDLKENGIVQSLSAHAASVTSVSFSPDGQLMVSASLDRSARIWNLADLSELPMTVDDHAGWVLSTEFIEDGRYVITGDASGYITYIPVVMDDLSVGLCQEVERNLSQEEWENYIGQGLEYQATCPNISGSK